MKKVRRRVVTGLVVTAFIIGALIVSYPTIADQWNKLHQSQAIASYDTNIASMTQTDYEAFWEEARAYNDTIDANRFFGDVFSGLKGQELEDTAYWQVLNMNGDGIMGYISIPEINEKLPIYHGTTEGVLQVATGHILGTKLPIGGAGNHAVICGHRGLPSAKLFSDLDQLGEGDKFYVHVFDQVLAYQVDQILPMVRKDDLKTLQAALAIDEHEDYVTLFTCTPYGINSHRLLVRGHRVPYNGEDDEIQSFTDSMLKTISEYNLVDAMLFVAIVLFIFMMIKLALRRKHRLR